MYDLVVVGHGAAGLSAAIAAAEIAKDSCILVLEHLSEQDGGGNTKWSPANTRMKSVDEMPAGFERDMMATTGGRGDPAYFARLTREAPDTMRWLEKQGVKFESLDYLLSAEHKRIHPVGGGAAIVQSLSSQAKRLGVSILYDARAVRLYLGQEAHGVELADGRRFEARSIVLASGGFEGSPALLREHFGPRGETLRPISPGSGSNAGDGIRMAIEAGASMSGDWSGMHSEPVDPRSDRAAALILIYPYGIVVDTQGNRFFDEGAGLVHDTWERFSRAVHFDTPDSSGWIVSDARLWDLPGTRNAIRTDAPPIQAPTLSELAKAMNVDPKAFAYTVDKYNAACGNDLSGFDPGRLDGLATADGLFPRKSNWARPLEKPPFVAFPVVCGIVYTFGGIATDADARVIGQNGPIERLFAAGEMTGHFYGTAPNSVAVMRSLVFGRIAGQGAAAHF
ncbi:FAD-binding protein [Bradyrhizobium sp. dw_78]|uniref:FAD-binding protein n=1 Tax=Bradyrhizobium sp. dw_78 TaxID=2719793 RepID=UPI001BD34222|nr:FAD-binding protein [Bradyrhizobium sp. dw_78]